MKLRTLKSEFEPEAKELRRLRSGLVKLSGDERNAEYINVLDLNIGYIHIIGDAGIDEVALLNTPISTSDLIKFKLCDLNFGKRLDWSHLADSPKLRADRNKQCAEQEIREKHRLWSSREHQQDAGVDANVGDMMRQCKSGKLRFKMLQNALDREHECFDFCAGLQHKNLKPKAKFRDGLMFEEAVRRTERRNEKGSPGTLTTRAAAEKVATRLYNIVLQMNPSTVDGLFGRYGADNLKLYNVSHCSPHSRRAKALVACIAAADLAGPRPFCDVRRAYDVLNLLWP
ncbi:hypothetical protein [Methylorubrum extorquens]